MTVRRIYIEDVEEGYAPPEMELLGVSMVGDVVFLEIVTVEETFDTETYQRVTPHSYVAVDLDELVSALQTLAFSEGV